MKIQTWRNYRRSTKIRLMLERFGTDDGLKLLEYSTLIGFAPHLLYDDNGHWAVSYDGGQCGSDPPSVIETFTDGIEWFDDPWDAIWWSTIESDLFNKIRSTTKKAPTLSKERK